MDALSDVAREMERAAADRVPTPVAAALAEHYTAEEAGKLYAVLDRIHRARLARHLVKQARRSGLTVEQAIAEVAPEIGRSEEWVSQVLYPRRRR